jgi:phospholipid-binding lipoprotein MlaA
VTRCGSRLGALAAALALCGCATTGGATNPKDPLEGLNRAVFSFNEAVDSAVLKPVASGYRALLPGLVRTGVANAFGNLGDAWSAVNQLLQGKLQASLEMAMRFGTNTLFGVGGLFDPATDLGLERKSEDFGQTLARWGVGNGAYLVLPILGPSTLRDSAALVVDFKASPRRLLSEPRDANALSALQIISARAALLEAGKFIDEAAFDKYILLRDGWLARRRNQIYDGDPPDEPEAEQPK